jgi:hypothetical protein
MSKTPFRMPNRAAAPASKIDEWVSGGEGGPAPPVAKPEKGKVARLTIDLPPELHARFKAGCALKGTRMIDEVRRLIEEWTDKNV